MSRVRTQSAVRSKFDLRLRSGICCESRSKLTLGPRGRVVCAANSQGFTPLRVILSAKLHACQRLWKCQDGVLPLPCRGNKRPGPPGEQCKCLFGGTATVRVMVLVAVVTSLGDVRNRTPALDGTRVYEIDAHGRVAWRSW